MGITGFIIWFPVQFTQFLPGGVVPASKMAHSTESVVAAIFIVIWHFYHVHIERLNLSIFTGRLSEDEMKKFHGKEYERITGQPASKPTEDK
jgi:cytochrome b subunit of formate dehydrogenase